MRTRGGRPGAGASDAVRACVASRASWTEGMAAGDSVDRSAKGVGLGRTVSGRTGWAEGSGGSEPAALVVIARRLVRTRLGDTRPDSWKRCGNQVSVSLAVHGCQKNRTTRRIEPR